MTGVNVILNFADYLTEIQSWNWLTESIVNTQPYYTQELTALRALPPRHDAHKIWQHLGHCHQDMTHTRFGRT